MYGIVHQPRGSVVRGAKRDDVSNRAYPVRRQGEGSPGQIAVATGGINSREAKLDDMYTGKNYTILYYTIL